MIPSERDMVNLAFAFESQLHKAGWDNVAPALYMIIASDDRSAVHLSATPVQPVDADQDPVDGLLLVAKFWASGMMDGELQAMRASAQDSMVGLVFSCEAWASDVPPEGRDGRDLADIVGTQECRNVFLVDCAGRVVWVERVRGKQPTCEVIEVGRPDSPVARGRIPTALGVMLQSMMKFARPASVDRAALNLLIETARL